MILIGICDSIESDANSLCNYIDIYFTNYSYAYSIIRFESAEKLISYYGDNSEPIDLLFIDIDLSDANGFETAKKIRKLDNDISIVFNTKNSKYTLKCFELWPLYYNIKPINFNLTGKIVDRYLQLYKHVKEENLLVKYGKKYINLSYNEITYIESQNTTLKIHLNNYEILKTYGKLDDIENQLSNKRFLRCHKSFLINMDYVKSVEAYKFTTIFGDTVSIKQREAFKIKNIYKDYVIQKEKLEKEKNKS